MGKIPSSHQYSPFGYVFVRCRIVFTENANVLSLFVQLVRRTWLAMALRNITITIAAFTREAVDTGTDTRFTVIVHYCSAVVRRVACRSV